MPDDELKGLLPGRGPAGRGPAGRGPGVGPGAGMGADCPDGASDCVLPVPLVTVSAGVLAEPSLVAAGGWGAFIAGVSAAGVSPVVDSSSCVGVGTAFLAGAFLAGAFLAGASTAGMASLSVRTTGASTVEEADFTNSPSSCNLVRTSLLETPSSLASSWTRTFDTTLLSLARAYAPSRQCERRMVISARSSGVSPHEGLPNGGWATLTDGRAR